MVKKNIIFQNRTDMKSSTLCETQLVLNESIYKHTHKEQSENGTYWKRNSAPPDSPIWCFYLSQDFFFPLSAHSWALFYPISLDVRRGFCYPDVRGGRCLDPFARLTSKSGCCCSLTSPGQVYHWGQDCTPCPRMEDEEFIQLCPNGKGIDHDGKGENIFSHILIRAFLFKIWQIIFQTTDFSTTWTHIKLIWILSYFLICTI